MKTALFLAGMIISGFAIAQSPALIEEADLPQIGDNFIVATASPLIAFDGEDTGPDHNWDFGWLTPTITDTTHWIDENDTDPLYFFLWLTSDIAEQAISNIENDFITIEDVFNFYELSNDRFAFSGFAGTILDIPFPIWYEENETILELPATYGQSTTSYSGFDFEIPGVGGWAEQRERFNDVDGWGSITTPAGTYDVIRLKSVINIVDTFSYDVTVIPFAYTTTEYSWFAPGEGIPVLKITLQNVLGVETITSVTYKTGELTAITTADENANAIQIAQPIQEILQGNIDVVNGGTYVCSLVDMQGRIVSSWTAQFGNGTNNIEQDVHALSSGVYVLQIENTQGEKITKTCLKQ